MLNPLICPASNIWVLSRLVRTLAAEVSYHGIKHLGQFIAEKVMILSSLNRMRRKLHFLNHTDRFSSNNLQEFDYLGGDPFQIYSVKGGRLYEHLNLQKYPITMARSVIFKEWVRPVLAELENRIFCIHLGDVPWLETIDGMPNLCYCKKKDDQRKIKLIPDAHYQALNGYVKNRDFRKLYRTRWEKKAEKLIFRGSCTGENPLGINMRAQLCSLKHPLIDARISRVNNGWSESDLSHLLGNEMSKYQMAHYKYQVDVDGNSNSWDAFFWKLMSGSLTFKMRSDWYQWYYPVIEAGVHYIEFTNFDELIDKVSFYVKHDDLAREVALNAQNFTKRFRFEDQYIVFKSVLDE